MPGTINRVAPRINFGCASLKIISLTKQVSKVHENVISPIVWASQPNYIVVQPRAPRVPLGSPSAVLR